MPTFIVSVREVHVQMVRVKAETPDDARRLVAEGEGEYLDGALEYSHTMDVATATVEKEST